MTSPWAAITPDDESQALGSITKMLTGTKMLQDQPGVVYALAQQNAHPADAGAIDQFMQGLDAEKQVRLAEATGQKIQINQDMKNVLQGIGVDYSHVEYTHQDALDATAKQISDTSNGQLQAKVDPATGKYVTNAQGQLVSESTAAPKSHYKAKGFGRLFHTLNNDIVKPIERDVLSPTLHALGRAYNVVDYNISNGMGSTPDATTAADMTAQGYDPNSILSTLAYESSGHAHSNTADLVNQFDTDNPSGLFGHDGRSALAEVDRFLNDPKKYREEIMQDPANFEKSTTGQTIVSPAGQQKLDFLNSTQFSDLAKRLNAHSATAGNELANNLGIDPVKHDTAYALTSAATNLVVSFAIDPTLVALKVAKTAQVARIGIDTLGDSQGAVRVLSGNNEVTRGWQRGIDLADQIRAAHAADDQVKVAGLTAKFNAELPGLSPIMDEFIGGGSRLAGHKEVIKDGKPILEPTFEDSGGIRSMQDAVNFVGSKYGLVRLINGRAATQSSLMPGALSAFGVRKLKGAVAGWMTERSALRAENAYKTVISAAKADPGLAEKLIESGDLERMGAQADDAVTFHNENVIAHKPFLNTRDEIRQTIGKLSQRVEPIQADIKATQSELDDLETRLQALHGDKAADPAKIAELHDQIQTGRDLLAMHEAALAKGGTKPALEALNAHNAELAADENAPIAGAQYGSAPIGKEPGTGEFNEQMSPEVGYTLTHIGKGNVTRNLRKTGDPLGDRGAFGWASPTAIAARTRLAAQRFTTMLPRNTMIDIEDAASSDKLYKMAMTYLNRGDANTFRASWNLGDGGTRKALITGLIDQIGHAAGLGSTESGKKILDEAKTVVEDYSTTGDNVLLNGQTLALHAGQVRTVWTLPSFQSLQLASKKIGLFDATMGRALTSKQADVLMSQWKLGALMKPNTVTRNQLEGWLRTALEGKFGEAVKARAFLTAPNKELWAKGFEKESKAEHDALVAAGDLKGAKQIANASRLSGETLGRSIVTQKIAEFAPIALAGRAYRSLMGRHMDEATVDAMLTLGKDELATAMEEYGQQIREADLGTRRAAREATEITKAGYGPAKIRYAINAASRKGDKAEGKSASWTKQDADGLDGANRYEHALAMRVNATPDVARAVLGELKNEADGIPVDLDRIVEALDDPSVAQKMRLTGYGKVTWDDPNGAARTANSAAEAYLGKREWANKMVNDYRHLVTGQDGNLSTKLVDEITRTGKAPTADWIATNLKNAQRPEGVLAEEVTALANGGVRGAIQALQDFEGGAYQWMVERPLQRTTSSPVFLANYAEARVGLNKLVDTMVSEHGFSREAVENMAKELSIKNAWVKTEQLIDDPGLKTQFDVMARNMFPFSRATQAMIRRWGTGLWQDPARARKMMLAYEGAEHSGFVYDNAYGEPTFTYPASGVLNMAMRQLAQVPGFESLNYFPLSSTMTGGVLMAVPGADNPFRMGMGPMLSIPMREIFKLFPDKRSTLDQVDSFINGPIGVGETTSQLVPTLVRRFYTAMDSNQQDSALASATTGAIANLAAAGMLPKPDASPSELAAFRKHLEAQVHNQLIVRAIFGLIAPAAMSSPTEGTSASQADYAFHVSGLGQLSDEYKEILNETGSVPRANAVWAALHPDQFVTKNNITVPTVLMSAYSVPHTAATVSKVALPATAESLNWMSKNIDFLNKYASVGAYFLPMQDSSGAFNDQAYKTQKELGLRQAKTPQQFYEDVEVRNAESTFYPAVDGFHKRIDAAKAMGDAATAKQWTDAMSQWEKSFKAANPLFAKKLDQYGDARAEAVGQLSDIHKMLKDGQVPDGQAPLLSALVANYEGLAAFSNKHRGADNQSTAMRSAALAMFNDWASKNITGTSLADLYSGVFRTLNTNLVNVSTPYGG